MHDVSETTGEKHKSKTKWKQVDTSFQRRSEWQIAHGTALVTIESKNPSYIGISPAINKAIIMGWFSHLLYWQSCGAKVDLQLCSVI